MDQPLEVTIGQLLLEKRMWLATAESCTGGLVGHLITNVPGSSNYYRGGVISYANEAKMDLLGVRAGTLEKFGAVSEQTVLEMARGVREALRADLGIAVSGIAGPAGGTPEKPVGTVWIGLSGTHGELVDHHVWNGNREAVKDQSAQAALRLVVAYFQVVNRKAD
jgi:PncC family amidohydrolase